MFRQLQARFLCVALAVIGVSAISQSPANAQFGGIKFPNPAKQAEEARRKVEEAARKKAEEARRVADEGRRRADEAARKKAEEAKRRADEARERAKTPGGMVIKPPAITTITLYRGVISMGKAFDFDIWLKWDTSKGKIRATGKIQFAGNDLVVSDAECRIVNGNTLEINKSWVGKSGLRVHTVIHFKPHGDHIHWDATYHGENMYTDKGKISGKKSGVLKPDRTPWKQTTRKPPKTGSKPPNWFPKFGL